jgi:hypothetical protein
MTFDSYQLSDSMRTQLAVGQCVTGILTGVTVFKTGNFSLVAHRVRTTEPVSSIGSRPSYR